MQQGAVTRWAHAAFILHAEVSASCDDPLLRAINELHRPTIDVEGMPTCAGCDADRPDLGEPVWPCRTTTLLARHALGIADVERYLIHLRDATPLVPEAWRAP